MKISKLIKELQHVLDTQGDMDCGLQNTPEPGERIISEEILFVVPEEYEEGWVCNLRMWPY